MRDISGSNNSSISDQAEPHTFSPNSPEGSLILRSQLSTHPPEHRMIDPFTRSLLKDGFFVIWVSGTIIILMRLIWGFYGAHKLSREADDLKGSFWHYLLKRILETISIKKKVDFFKHEKVKVPLTWGWLKPVVVMPGGSNSWTEEQRASALYHELSHVKRGDFCVLMLARISLAIYWFNPLCWLMFRLIKIEQEKACDELVLKTGIKPSTYAANLLSIQRSVQSPWNPSVIALGALGRSSLHDRLVAILKKKLKLKEVRMRTKIIFSFLVILTITFLGMARSSGSNGDLNVSGGGNVSFSENSRPLLEAQEKKEEKKDRKKSEKKEDKDKKKDIYVWHLEEGEKGGVEAIIAEKDKIKSFTINEPIIIHTDESGKQIAFTSDGKSVEIKKGEEGTWLVKGEALRLHEDMEAIDLGEGSVVTLKTRTKEGHKTIEIEAPAVILKKVDESNTHTIEVSEEGGKKKDVVVPHVHVKHHPEVQVHLKEAELKKIHAKLLEIYERLSKKMESKTEEEEQALKEMEETLKKMEKKLATIKENLKDITLRINEEPHRIRLKNGQAISIKHKTKSDETDKDFFYISKDEDHLMSFVDDKGEATFLAHMTLEKTQNQAFTDAVSEIEMKLPAGYALESEFDDESGKALIKIKGSANGRDMMDAVLDLLKSLKERLGTKNLSE